MRIDARALLALAVLAAAPRQSRSDDTAAKAKIESIQFITSIVGLEHNFDRQKFVDWVKQKSDGLPGLLPADTPRDMVVQVTLFRAGPARIEVAARPAMADDKRADVIQYVDASSAPRPRFSSATFRFNASALGGAPEKTGPLAPELSNPAAEQDAEYRSAGVKRQLEMLRAWACEEVLPVIGAEFRGAAEEFDGVRKLGDAIGRLDIGKKLPVDEITDRSDSYWRAVLEMQRGNHIVPAARAFMLVANGEIDQSTRLIAISRRFSLKESMATAYLAELQRRIEILDGGVRAEILRGIQLHDQKKYDEAIDVYTSVLQEHPRSAWAHFEKYYSETTRKLGPLGRTAERTGDWEKARKVIYNCDPLYATGVSASTGREAYMLQRRLSLRTLFAQTSETGAELVTFADIAFELEDYSMAAHAYWIAVAYVKPEVHGNRELMANFLYCADKLGATGVKDFFQGDHANSFAAVEAELEERIRSSEIFQKMKKKE